MGSDDSHHAGRVRCVGGGLPLGLLWGVGFVPPGSVRVEAVSSDPTVLASAYLVGTKVVVVALNTGPGEKLVQVAFGAGTPCVQLVSSERSSSFETARVLDPVALTAPGFTVPLPATSVTTFVATP